LGRCQGWEHPTPYLQLRLEGHLQRYFFIPQHLGATASFGSAGAGRGPAQCPVGLPPPHGSPPIWALTTSPGFMARQIMQRNKGWLPPKIKSRSVPTALPTPHKNFSPQRAGALASSILGLSTGHPMPSAPSLPTRGWQGCKSARWRDLP